MLLSYYILLFIRFKPNTLQYFIKLNNCITGILYGIFVSVS